MNCIEKDCPNEAVCAVQLNVPATGHEVGFHIPISVVMAIPLCDTHFKSTRPDQFFGIEGSPLESVIRLQARGRAEPDFSRAFVSRCEFDSPEWKALNRPK